MNAKYLLSSRTALAALAAIVCVAGQALAAFLGLDGSSGGLFANAWGAGDTGLLLWLVGHCDGMDGPVVSLARKALETGNVKSVLPWVRPQDEDEIRRSFDHALAVRKLGPAARELADLHFFETLVRVHRAGEGAPYTGLKPAGRDLGPAIPAADRALEDGSVDALVGLVTDAVAHGIRERFQAARDRRGFDPNDVEAGRKYVEAYVPYIHFVERLFDIAKESAHGHAPGQPAIHAAH